MSRMRVVLGPPPLMRCIPLRLWLSIRVKRMSNWRSMVLRRIRPRRGCGPGRMSRGTPRRHGTGLIGVVIGLGCPLHSLLVRYGSMWPPLIHIIEWFSDLFSPLMCNFNFGQGWALIHRMVSFTDKTNFYGVKWTFIPRMLSSAPRIKDGQSPLDFLFPPLDLQGI